MKDNKYGDIDQLLSGADEPEEQTPARTRRPSPALAVMSGDRRVTSVTDTLKADKQKAEQALEEAIAKFQREKLELEELLDEALNSEDSSTPIVLTMPVTKQEVTFTLQRINPDLIDVSPENERIQKFLDEISLQDILPSIKKHGQQKPGTIRPKANGRFELIEGSRRLASVKLAKKEYMALVGDVPDADVRELSIIENKHKDVSPFEKAKVYQKMIEAGEYETWTQLGAAYGISSSHISRYRACVELDEMFVGILPTPSDMPLSYGETLAKLVKKDEQSLKAKAKELLKLREHALKGEGEFYDVEEIIKQLKSSVRSKVDKSPTKKNPVLYTGNNGESLKHSLTSKGDNKFELHGCTDEQVKQVLEFMKKTLKVKI